MIIKKRSPQLNFLGVEALMKRMDSQHHKFKEIENFYFRAKAGVSGKVYVDQQLDGYVHYEPHLIIQDLHLKSSTFFQIDNLFLTKSYALIIEVKNIRHTVELMQDPFYLKQTNPDGAVTIMDSPEDQLDKNITWLNDWLEKRNWNIPVYGVIVFTNSDSHIIANKCHFDIVRPRYLTNKIRKMPIVPVLLSDEQLSKLGADLLKSHSNYRPKTLLHKFKLNPRDIRTGVECPICFEIGMTRNKRKWVCSNLHYSEDAHVKVLDEYFLIFGGEITNKEFRRFFHVEGKDVANRLLKGMNLLEKGQGRWRTYQKHLY